MLSILLVGAGKGFKEDGSPNFLKALIRLGVLAETSASVRREVPLRRGRVLPVPREPSIPCLRYMHVVTEGP